MIGFVLRLACFQIETPSELAEVGRAFGVKIEVVDRPSEWRLGYRVEADASNQVALNRYAKLFANEVLRYPKEIFSKAMVSHTTFCTALRMNGQSRASVPAFGAGEMFYDTSLGAHSPPYQRVVIHHEFFHMIDQRLGFLTKDAEWSALNQVGFHYGNGGKNMQVRGAGELTDKLPGLITPYGGSAIEEDKAELFAHLITDPEFVGARAKTDPVLLSKINLLKRRLSAWLPDLNEKFWPTSTDQAK